MNNTIGSFQVMSGLQMSRIFLVYFCVQFCTSYIPFPNISHLSILFKSPLPFAYNFAMGFQCNTPHNCVFACTKCHKDRNDTSSKLTLSQVEIEILFVITWEEYIGGEIVRRNFWNHSSFNLYVKANGL